MNRRTLPVERRKSAFQIITGKISNANGNATSATQEPHAVSLLATGLALFDLKTTLHSGNMVAQTKETTDYTLGLICRRQLNKQLTNFVGYIPLFTLSTSQGISKTFLQHLIQ